MFRTAKEFEDAMDDFLKSIRDNENPKEQLMKLLDIYDDADGGDALGECIDRDFIRGIKYSIKDNQTNEFAYFPRQALTYAGLKFLDERH